MLDLAKTIHDRWNMTALSRTRLARLCAAMLLGAIGVAAGRPSTATGADLTLRIGVQKYGTLVILQHRGSLEKRLAARGVTVLWTEFPGGPQLLDALSAGTLDFGTTGEAPPVFAQAAGAPLLYVAVEPPAPAGEAILVPKESPLRSVADLKGKRIALNKGSNVHYLLAQALAGAGLTPGDIRPVFLAPEDGRAAFESGGVDAWAIWDPYLAATQAATGARTLVDGQGLVSNHQFYLATRQFAAAHPDLVQAILAELDAVDRWAALHQEEVAELLSPRTGIPVGPLTTSLARLAYGVKPVDESVIADQQRIADDFHELGLIPKKIAVREAVWIAPKP
jgi:sulfonate transport system substrate-binding protein